MTVDVIAKLAPKNDAFTGLVDDDQVVFADNTDGNASTSKHGYLKKLSNTATEFMNGQGNWATPSGSGGGNWTLIEDINLSAADAASFDFQSIAITYKHLKILLDSRTDRAAAGDSVKMILNNDTGNNYVGWIQWDGTTGKTEYNTARAPFEFVYTTGNTAPANYFNNSEITLFDYANTNKYHSWQARGMQLAGTGTGVSFIYDAMGLYLSTTAISRITLLPVAGSNFKQYSRATLYGLS